MSITDRQRAGPPIVEWIVCGGCERDARGGSVVCPLTEDRVDLRACLLCRHLAWAAGERDRHDPCELPELS